MVCTVNAVVAINKHELASACDSTQGLGFGPISGLLELIQRPGSDILSSTVVVLWQAFPSFSPFSPYKRTNVVRRSVLHSACWPRCVTYTRARIEAERDLALAFNITLGKSVIQASDILNFPIEGNFASVRPSPSPIHCNFDHRTVCGQLHHRQDCNRRLWFGCYLPLLYGYHGEASELPAMSVY